MSSFVGLINLTFLGQPKKVFCVKQNIPLMMSGCFRYLAYVYRKTRDLNLAC